MALPLSSAFIRRFRRRLLSWYSVHRRDLPWRRTRDPYKILLAEVMLQQTQVDRVAPKFIEWSRRYPTVHALANAPLARLKQQWRPLGYNARPARLKALAWTVVRAYGGRVPEEESALLGLPGVGKYTAGAVRSIAFGHAVLALDTHLLRVLSRIFAVNGDGGPTARRRRIEAIARRLVPRGRAGDFNQALMDLGSALCLPQRPRCGACPLRALCLAYHEGRVEPSEGPRRRRTH